MVRFHPRPPPFARVISRELRVAGHWADSREADLKLYPALLARPAPFIGCKNFINRCRARPSR